MTGAEAWEGALGVHGRWPATRSGCGFCSLPSLGHKNILGGGKGRRGNITGSSSSALLASPGWGHLSWPAVSLKAQSPLCRRSWDPHKIRHNQTKEEEGAGAPEQGRPHHGDTVLGLCRHFSDYFGSRPKTGFGLELQVKYGGFDTARENRSSDEGRGARVVGQLMAFEPQVIPITHPSPISVRALSGDGNFTPTRSHSLIRSPEKQEI